MTQKKKRAKNEPTNGDTLAQAYRNRAAMHRVYWAAYAQNRDVLVTGYWSPRNMDAWEVK